MEARKRTERRWRNERPWREERAQRAGGGSAPGAPRRLWGALAAAALLVGLVGGVASAQDRGGIPAPAEVIGFEMGSDHRLADFGEIHAYFRAVAEASDRMAMERIGTSVEGRPLVMAVVSSAENLRHRERYREIARRLATGDAGRQEARRLSREGKAVVWIDAGLHSTEVATSQHMPDLAHHLVTSDDPEVRKIRENVILLLMPVMNPDGQEIVVDWYRENLGTRFETAPLPVLYHEYVGHDNNRDWFMNLMPETRAVTHQLWFRWYPQIVYNHHQAGEPPPLIFVPPFADPMNPRVPPLVNRGINLVGSAMAYRFARQEKPGVVSRETYTEWWNGGMRTAPYFHNQIGILTETYHHAYATPKRYREGELPDHFGSGRSTRRPSVFYSRPWDGGWWRLSDQLDYEFIGSMAVADVAADLKEQWLFDSWRMARDAIEAGRAGDPYAYVIPPPSDQHDAGAAAEMLTVLRHGGIQIERATAPFTAGGRNYPAGSWIARAGQPYRAHLMDMLEQQRYPTRREYPGGPPVTPYDLAGWTLPIQMGVRVDRVDRPFEAETRPVEEKDVTTGKGTVTGDGPVHLLSARRNDAYRAANRLLAAGAGVRRARAGFRAAGRDWPAGTFVVRARTRVLERIAAREGVGFVASSPPVVETSRLRRPRIALYKSWVPTMDEGWTRWVLEEWGFAHDTIHDGRLRRGGLRGDYDVLILPSQEADEILNGWAEGRMPERYIGGVGSAGSARIERFVREGGTLVALDEAGEFAIQALGLPVRNALSGVSREEFFVPGSLIRASVDASDPLGWGMTDTAGAYFVRSLAFEAVPPAEEANSAAGPKRGERAVDVAVRYARDDLLMSGWETGAEEHLSGRPAVIRVPLGEGRVVLAGFRTQFRGQPRGTFKLLFNAILAGTTDPLPFVPTVESDGEGAGPF